MADVLPEHSLDSGYTWLVEYIGYALDTLVVRAVSNSTGWRNGVPQSTQRNTKGFLVLEGFGKGCDRFLPGHSISANTLYFFVFLCVLCGRPLRQPAILHDVAAVGAGS